MNIEKSRKCKVQSVKDERKVNGTMIEHQRRRR